MRVDLFIIGRRCEGAVEDDPRSSIVHVISRGFVDRSYLICRSTRNETQTLLQGRFG